MSYREAEIAAMRQAITISAFGLGSTSPNPPVGCVILDRDGAPVGQGYHRRKGEPHAEANALAAAGSRAAGGTAVVTLEPCNHHGRTPPCHQALLDAGIARVLIALIDPTSRGQGGAARLRQAGIDVEVGLLADEALTVLRPWLDATVSGRPHVRWLYEVRPDGAPAHTSRSLALATIRSSTDAVIYADGRVEEGYATAHAVAVFAMPESVPVDQPAAALRALHTGGARSVLLHAGSETAEPFLERRLVDEVDVLLPNLPESTSERPHLALPPGFQASAIVRVDAGLLVHAQAISLQALSADNHSDEAIRHT